MAGADRGLQGRLASGSGGGNWKASQDLRSTGWLVIPGDPTHPCSPHNPPKTALWRQAIICPMSATLGRPFSLLDQECPRDKTQLQDGARESDIIITAQPSNQQATNRFKLHAY